MKTLVKEFFDKATWTLTFVIYDETTKDAIVLDPVWDYDPATSKLSTQSVEQVLEFINQQALKVHYILETHAHADHISASQALKQRIPGAQVGIGASIKEVQKVFKNFFNLGEDFKTDGSQFDILMEEGKDLQAGSLTIKTLFTPGHTPACAAYIIGESVFIGDTLFMPDSGTGRCDFPRGSAEDLYHSITEKIFKLPDHYTIYTGHDYLPNGRPLTFQTTVAEQKEKNIQINKNISREQFLEFRKNRDKTLSAPRLLLQSVQININAGHLPDPENNKVAYLKIPIS